MKSCRKLASSCLDSHEAPLGRRSGSLNRIRLPRPGAGQPRAAPACGGSADICHFGTFRSEGATQSGHGVTGRTRRRGQNPLPRAAGLAVGSRGRTCGKCPPDQEHPHSTTRETAPCHPESRARISERHHRGSGHARKAEGHSQDSFFPSRF